MSSALDALRGSQTPRLALVPEFTTSRGTEALECAARAGLVADPWQEFVIHSALGVRDDGKWASFENGVCVPRQNGKGGIIEIRELAGLFVLGERLIIHSAHQFDTSLEAFRRLLWLIEDTPDYERQVKRVSRSHGEEGIELKTGQRIRFRTRTKGGGRGFTGDCLMLDEAMFLPEMALAAILPTVSARPNPQVWYLGSSVDQLIHEYGVVFSRVRERGITGKGSSLAYFEWSAEIETPDELEETVSADENVWAQANPALGIRISEEHIGFERYSMDPRTFAVERLGVGDWPRTDGLAELVIHPKLWASLEDKHSIPLDPVYFSFDVPPDRSRACIAAAGLRSDGLLHAEIVERRPGTDWLAERLVELLDEHEPAGVSCDGIGPASSLIPRLDLLEVEVETVSTADVVRACGLLFDNVQQDRLRHLGTQELTAAIKGAVRRPLGDSWAWSRRNSSIDISPLVAVTLAIWGISKFTENSTEPMFSFA